MEVVFCTILSAPSKESQSLGSGGSMVEMLDLKRIDEKAPPGVELAAWFDSAQGKGARSRHERGFTNRLFFLEAMGGAAWPFFAGRMICLADSINERDPSLLNRCT